MKLTKDAVGSTSSHQIRLGVAASLENENPLRAGFALSHRLVESPSARKTHLNEGARCALPSMVLRFRLARGERLLAERHPGAGAVRQRP